jgi:curved DNA-binding protein
VTPTGETVTVKVPEGTSSGRRLRLRGRGVPNPKGTAGDLYAEVRIATPTHLTERQRELFTELAALDTDSTDHHRGPGGR